MNKTYNNHKTQKPGHKARQGEKMNEEELKRQQKKLGLKNKDFAEYCKVSVRSVERWRAGSVPIPGTVERLVELALKAQGDDNKNGEDDLLSAEQQLLGFKFALSEGNISSLIKNMGLSKDEWNEKQKLFNMSFLTDDDIEEISIAVCSK